MQVPDRDYLTRLLTEDVVRRNTLLCEYLDDHGDYLSTPAGCDFINEPNSLGNTALHYVCANPKIWTKVLKRFLDYGADLHVMNNKGFTPFILCILFCDIKKLRLLFQREPALFRQTIQFKYIAPRERERVVTGTPAQICQYPEFEYYVKNITIGKNNMDKLTFLKNYFSSLGSNPNFNPTPISDPNPGPTAANLGPNLNSTLFARGRSKKSRQKKQKNNLPSTHKKR